MTGRTFTGLRIRNCPYSAAGIPAGMLLGFLSAKGTLRAALNQLPTDMFLAQDTAQLQELISSNGSGKWGYLLLSAFITFLFAFLAAAPAARYAAKVSPVTAMHGTARVKIRRKRRGTKRIRNFERYYAGLNLRCNRSRILITVVSLTMSITVFITLQGVRGLIGVESPVSKHLGDYSVVNEYDGFAPEELIKMEENQNVEAVAAQQFSGYELDEKYYPTGIETDFTLGIGEYFQIFGVNDYWADCRLRQIQMDASGFRVCAAGIYLKEQRAV